MNHSPEPERKANRPDLDFIGGERMSSSYQVGCDNCNRDLTTTGNSIAWRLSLNPEVIPSASGAVTDMYFAKPLAESAHFCDMGCLKAWIAKN